MSFRLPTEMIAHLDALAQSDRRSRGAVVRIAIEQFLEQHPMKNNKPKQKPAPRKKKQDENVQKISQAEYDKRLGENGQTALSKRELSGIR